MHSKKKIFYAETSRQETIVTSAGAPKRSASLTWLWLLKQSKERKANRNRMASQPETYLVNVATQTDSAIVVPWMHELLGKVRSMVPAKLICNCEWSAYIKGRHWRTTIMCILILGISFLILDRIQSIISKWRRLTKL